MPVKFTDNFYLLRLIAATLVIISHSFALCGQESSDIIYRFAGTSAYQNLGYQAVKIFFIISGYCVTSSYLTSRNWLHYLIKRVLRILPGLVVCLLITTLLAGLLFSKLSFWGFIADPMTFTYVLDNSLLLYKPTAYFLPYVFQENIYANVVNGSIWSLPYEALMYLIILAAGLARLFKQRILFTLVWMALTGYWLFDLQPQFQLFSGLLPSLTIELAMFFFSGSVIYLWNDRIWWSNKLLAIFIMLLMGSMPSGLYLKACPLLLPYIIISIGRKQANSVTSKLSDLGDLSYGLYLYAFPIQQAFSAWSRKPSPVLLMIAGINLSLFFAYFSWKYVEKPATKLVRLIDWR